MSIEKYGNGFTATDLKNCIAYNNKTEWAYNLEQFGFYKPNRISPGKTMTVGKVWKEERSDIGYEELTDTLQKTVFAFEDFIHYCHEKIASCEASVQGAV